MTSSIDFEICKNIFPAIIYVFIPILCKTVKIINSYILQREMWVFLKNNYSIKIVNYFIKSI